MAQSDKGMPQIGMIFKSKEEAWLFWAAYRGRVGFEVRKRYSNKSKIDGVITSCKYVCAKEGKRQNIQRESIQKCFRPETRTNCDARMCIQLDRLSGNFEVTDVVLEHNHLLYLPQTCHLMVSQRKISEFQAFEIEAADDSGIMPKAAYELATRRVGGPFNLGYTSRDHRNLLQSKRQRELAFGQAGSMLKYFHDKIAENPSFQYALQLDCEEHIANIFWADAKMMLDYAYHGLCTFHIMQNAVKHLSSIKGEEKDEGEEKVGDEKEEDKESHILTDFGACMYGFEDKAAFEEAFDNMRSKVHKQTWLNSIYKVKEKWAECFMRDVFTLGVRSTQLSESFNNSLKNHLKSDFHIVRFLKHFERTVEDKRNKELQSEFEARKYVVAIARLHGDLTYEDERIVLGDHLNKTVTCSCRMFERTGILCGHGLKVLDLMNIKTLPTHYVMKRWTREARKGNILDKHGRNVVENPKLEAMLRYKELSHKFHTMAHKVANSAECCMLLENALDTVGPKLEEKLNASASAMEEPSNDKENADPNVQQIDDLLRAAQLKKKEVQPKSLRRKKSWLDKMRKGKRKAPKPAISTKKAAKQQKKNDDIQPQVEVEAGGHKEEANLEEENYNLNFSFTKLLTASTCDDDSFYGENMF